MHTDMNKLNNINNKPNKKIDRPFFIGKLGTDADTNPFLKNEGGMLFGPGNKTFENLLSVKIENKLTKEKYPYGPPEFTNSNGEPNKD